MLRPAILQPACHKSKTKKSAAAAADMRKIFKPAITFLVLHDMRKSSIHIEVSLDQQNIPEKIEWHASDHPGQVENTKSFALSFWDAESSAIMRIDLWTKDMLVGEMKRFFLQTLGGMNDTLRSATNDDTWYEEVETTLQKLARMLQEEESGAAS